jgi:hypothetical protein
MRELILRLHLRHLAGLVEREPDLELQLMMLQLANATARALRKAAA